MWSTIVDCAILEKVNLLALSGDIVDQLNRFCEALGPLEDGLRRLAQAGIVTCAVAGNHDYNVLPRIQDTIGAEHFRLLGRGGRWEQTEIHVDGRLGLIVQGWSFPRESVKDNPLASYQPPTDSAVPTIALLHTEVDVPDSNYAPVRRQELQQLPVTLWVLGHVHIPSCSDPAQAGPIVLSPGSPVALDPTETGPHGPWMVEIEGLNRVMARQFAMSRVRYEQRTVDVSGVADQPDLEQRLAAEVRQALSEAVSNSSTEYISLRLRLTGRTPLDSTIRGNVEQNLNDLALSNGDVTAGVERVIFDTRPAVDLTQLANGRGHAALLARTLRDLESEAIGPEVESLVRMAHEKTKQIHASTCYSLISRDAPPSRDDARQWLIRQCTAVLDELVAQKEQV